MNIIIGRLLLSLKIAWCTIVFARSTGKHIVYVKRSENHVQLMNSLFIKHNGTFFNNYLFTLDNTCVK